MQYQIKTVTTKEKLYELYIFFCKTFYEEDKKANETYSGHADVYETLQVAFEIDHDFLLYIEDEENHIIASVAGKNINVETKSINLAGVGTNANYQNKGLGRLLMEKFEEVCKNKGIQHISFGARTNAIKFYEKLKYNAIVHIAVYDFVRIDKIEQCNEKKYHFKIVSKVQELTKGYVEFETDQVEEEILDYFENSIETAKAKYIFYKQL